MNKVLAVTNFLGLILSIPIICYGLWLKSVTTYFCEQFQVWRWVVIVGTIISVAAMAGSIAGIFGISWLIKLNLFAKILLMILLLCLLIIVHIVTLRSDGSNNIDDFSLYLRRRVTRSSIWDHVRSCISQSDMCADLNRSYRTAQDFRAAFLTPMQSGCCMPPTQCRYTFVSPTNWISPIDMAADMDCVQWNNNQTQLCYNCDSCKIGLLANSRNELIRCILKLFITFLVLLIFFLIELCAFICANTDDHSLRDTGCRPFRQCLTFPVY
ncbi:unnamed protein product [Sphenostylis stenocarpa]|uniref:Tetraspanin n=1 Tax=Sphenostylis stenocarpa TaxID=92480 RepID=A0AA86V940_9FABA|nr:unnamed protein product [Sphenostylis stenocarpa]